MSFDASKINPDCPGCQELQRALREALERIEQQQKQLEELERRVEELEREAHRQAAPFRRPEEQRSRNPRSPGRPKGHPGSYRKPPPQVDAMVAVPLERCPHCQGPVQRVHSREQVIEELELRVHRVRLITQVGRCATCGTVHSTHPLQVSTATGAAGTHLGPQAVGFAALLNKQLGLPLAKTCAVLRQCGLSLTPGGLTQLLHRLADRLQPLYEQLQDALRHSPAVHADETGWWVAGHSASAWVYATPDTTFYTIDNRSQQVVRRVLGDDYPGVLISDCLASYDPHPGRKSKCFSHHLRAVSKAQAQAPAVPFLNEIQRCLRAVLALHHARSTMAPAAYARCVQHLQAWLDRLLDAPHEHAAAIRIANRLRKHRPHLLTCLYVEGVEPTNNLAERQLRPLVIVRKLSCGNKTNAGKRTLEILASLAATCRQRRQDFAQLVAHTLPLQATGLPSLSALPP
jgi:transposase